MLTVAGGVEVDTTPVLQQELANLLERGFTRLIVDLKGVEFLDSSGLTALIKALKRVREQGGQFRIVCNSGPIRRLFEMTRLNQVFDIYSCQDDALAEV